MPVFIYNLVWPNRVLRVFFCFVLLYFLFFFFRYIDMDTNMKSGETDDNNLQQKLLTQSIFSTYNRIYLIFLV